MVCSVSLFIACLGKLGSQSLWVSEGTNETLLVFIGDFSGQPTSPKFKRRLFLQLLCGDTAEELFLPDFHHHGFPFPFFSFPDVLTLKTHRSQNQHQASMSVTTKA